jgi:hypothetical protein
MSERMSTAAEPRSGRSRVRVAAVDDRPAIVRFNERLANGGESHQFPLDPRLPGEADHRPDGFPEYRRLLVMADGEEIRAGVLQHHSTIFVQGEERDFCWDYLPISEGVVDRRYAMSIVLLMTGTLAEQPFQMSPAYYGSLDTPWDRFLCKLGWNHAAIPFFFYPIRPTRVLRGLPYLRERRWLKFASRFLAWSGVDHLLGYALAVRGRVNVVLPAYESRQEPCFAEWADYVFREALGAYGAAIRRDATTLNILYPPEDPRFVRLRVRNKKTGDELGWIVVIHRQMQGQKYFGDLHVGTLVDGFGRPENVAALLDAGRQYLAEQGVDLVAANWSHEAWVRASRFLGFLPGPSNYWIFVSPGGKPLFEPSCPVGAIHLSRGSGEGPGILLPRLPPGR